MPKRISLEEKLWQQLWITAARSTCTRGQVASLIVRDRRVISEGYNGAPPRMPHCLDVGCKPVEVEGFYDIQGSNVTVILEGCSRTIHAEANAVAWAARAGINIDGAEMWSTHSPCLECAKLIVSAGLRKLTYIKDYRASRLDILDDAGLEIVMLEDILALNKTLVDEDEELVDE